MTPVLPKLLCPLVWSRTQAVPVQGARSRKYPGGSRDAKSVLRVLLALLTLVATVLCPVSASDRTFTVPLEQLRAWSQTITVSINAEILGNSKVHAVGNDCEMHFGAKVPAYNGDPPGWVLEPMNLCLEPFPGKATASKKDWESFGADLKGAKVRVEGVPRIWPEHLVGGSDSNPNHAVELHPMTRLQRGNHIYDFADFIYAPDGFDGITEKTAHSILTDTEVSVTESDGMVEVNFDAGRIGNFAILQLSVVTNSIKELEGGFRMDGQVVLERKERVPVTLITVAGSEIGRAIAELKQRKRKNKSYAFEALVLFSLNPEALYQAAKESNGKEVVVQDPIQLIIYGEPVSER